MVLDGSEHDGWVLLPDVSMDLSMDLRNMLSQDESSFMDSSPAPKTSHCSRLGGHPSPLRAVQDIYLPTHVLEE